MQDILADMILYCMENVPLEVETVKVFDLGGKRRVVQNHTKDLRGQAPKCEADD